MPETTITAEETPAPEAPDTEAAAPAEEAASPEAPPAEQDDAADEEDDAESGRKSSLFARGCLEIGAVMLLLAGLFMLLESKGHVCLFYTWPPHVLSLSCMAGSFLALMTGLFALGRNAFAMIVMVLSGWTVLLVMAFIYLQSPEIMHTTIPGTEKNITLTLVSTPGSATLYIDEPLIGGVLSRHWALPVHDRNMPLFELIELREEEQTVELIFDGRRWAVYNPARDSWADVLHHEADAEETEPSE